MLDVYDKIKNHKGKRFIYGTGDGADKLIDHLQSIGVFVDGVCVSDNFYREQIFRGMKVFPVGKLSEEYPDGLFLMAFGVKNSEEIFSLSKKINLLYPEMPVSGYIPFDKDILNRDRYKIEKAFSLLADEKSKEVFECILRFRLSGDISFLKKCESDIEEGYSLIIKKPGEEILFDCGAYNGDTADDFNKFSAGLKNLYAAEPCEKNFKKLKEKYANCNLYCCAIGKVDGKAKFISSRGRGSVISNNTIPVTGKVREVNVRSVDSIIEGKNCTIIKYDVEGAEADALLGSVQTIKTHHPNLLIAAYHKYEDIYTLPLLLDQIQKGYKIQLRHHPCLPSWETNIFASYEG